MSHREFNINKLDHRNNNIKIDYINDDNDSSDNNIDDSFGLNLLANAKKIINESEHMNNIDVNMTNNSFTQNNKHNNINELINKSHKSYKSHKSSSSSSKKTPIKFNNLSSESLDNKYNPNNDYIKDNLQEILHNKQTILYQIEKLKASGYSFSKTYNISSNLEEMKLEVERITLIKNNKKGVMFCRNCLITLCSGIENLNDKMEIGCQLDGWTEETNMNIETYDDVFEELYLKYGHLCNNIAPELRLVFMIASSAIMYHISHAISGSVMNNFENLINKHSDNISNNDNNSGKNSGGGGGLSDLIGGLMGGGLGNFMNMAQSFGGNNQNQNQNQNQKHEYQPTIIEHPNINKTIIGKNIKGPELAGIETLLEDLSDNSKSTTTKIKNGKRILSF